LKRVCESLFAPVAFDAGNVIGAHRADFIIGTGNSPERDAEDMESICIRQLKNTLTREAGPDMEQGKANIEKYKGSHKKNFLMQLPKP